MFERHMLLTRGFQNVVEGGETVGFQIKIRIAYYCGIYLALINGVELTVDGKKYDTAQTRFSIGGRTYTMEELGREEKARWEFGEPATLRVLAAGGLEPGLHELKLEEAIKPPFIYGRGIVSQVTRKMTLVA